jgi:two-component system response regulator DegU
MNKKKIVVIDEQELFRVGIRRVLSAYPDFEITECTPSEDMLRLVEATMPDIILLGCRLNNPNDLEFSRQIVHYFPNARVIILSPDPDDEELFEVIKSSAIACINKSASSTELVATIKRVSIGENPVSNATMISHIRTRNEAHKSLRQFKKYSFTGNTGRKEINDPLTSREVEILNYIADGNTNRQIASALELSEQTIKNHVSKILRRSKANDRAHAVFLAIRHGLISLEAGQAS